MLAERVMRNSEGWSATTTMNPVRRTAKEIRMILNIKRAYGLA
jgi:hypothetical protein